VTERTGALRIVGSDGRIAAPIAGVPAVDSRGQGGLLDVALDPAFASNRRIYLSYAEPGTGADAGRSGTAVARAVLSADGTRLNALQVIFRQTPKIDSTAHFGSRLAFAPDGSLFVTLGDRYTQRDAAQDLSNTLGKVVRIRADGSVPPDNPFVGRADARPEIWSYGHRNVQGAAIHPTTGELWTHEHGPQGGDEVNITRPGRNYGWPRISYGCEYGAPVGNCTPVGGATSAPGMEQPLSYWAPTSIAPCGMAFYTASLFPQWRGSLFLGALAGQALWRLQLDGNRVVAREALFTELGERIRDVRQGSDGALYLISDGASAKIYRVQPA
jgi:glucose/arabinose dehydrogenase